TDEDDCSVKDPSIFTLPASQVPANNDFRCQPMFAYRCDQQITQNVPATYTGCKPLTGSYLQDLDQYYSFLVGVKHDPGLVVVATIAGARDLMGNPPDSPTTIQTGPVTFAIGTQAQALLPQCNFTPTGGGNSIGRPGIRLYDFTKKFGDHGLFRTICS